MKYVRLVRKDENAVSPVIATILMVAITVVLAAVLYVMVSGLLTGPGGGPQTIGISRMDTGTNWVLNVVSVPSSHATSSTTFLIRYASNQSIVVPPGQKSLDALKTASGGVQYIPVTGTTQTALQINDVITISKTQFPTNGYPIAISDGTTNLWTGTL